MYTSDLRPRVHFPSIQSQIAALVMRMAASLCCVGNASRTALIVVAFGLTACGSAPIRGSATLLDFLRENATTREQVILELGDPASAYDGSKIMTYKLNRDEGGYYLVRDLSRGWANAPLSLVLVFDDKGVLKTRSVVAVK